MIPELVARFGIIGDEITIQLALENQTACRGQHAAIPGIAMFHRPARFAGNRVPCDQASLQG